MIVEAEERRVLQSERTAQYRPAKLSTLMELGPAELAGLIDRPD